MNNSLRLWSEETRWVNFTRFCNSSRVKIHYSTSGISSGSLDIPSKISDHWRHSPGSDLSDKWSEIHSIFLESKLTLTPNLLLWNLYSSCGEYCQIHLKPGMALMGILKSVNGLAIPCIRPDFVVLIAWGVVGKDLQNNGNICRRINHGSNHELMKGKAEIG